MTKSKDQCDGPPAARFHAHGIVQSLGPASRAFESARAEWLPRIQSEREPRRQLDAWRELHAAYSTCSTPTTEDSAELFLRHAYLAVVARAVAASALLARDGEDDENGENGENGEDGDQAAATGGLLSAGWFAARGVESFLREPDLFGWPCGSAAARLIAREARSLDLADARFDALKLLHHAVMGSAERRPLGELYTPDWLAAWIVEDALRERPYGALLDPACGSGTFLFHAVLALRESAARPTRPKDILDRVHGADVNPLAVEMARANYLLALGPLLREAAAPFRIPVEERDALSCAPPPVRYAVVIGNPPWVPLRTLPPARQEILRELAARTYGLANGRGEMTTHVEGATLFVARCAEAALEDNGIVSFVLPRTVFTGEQHHALRTHGIRLPDAGSRRLTVQRVIDCERVAPLFATPAAALVFRKRPGDSAPLARIPLLALSGRLPHRDVSLAEARRLLACRTGFLALRTAGPRSWWGPAGVHAPPRSASPYKEQFRQGATLVPRTFWFVEISGREGGLARVSSAEPGKGGPVSAYRRHRLSGSVEAPFLFLTLLGDDLLPFAARRFRPLFLPALEENGSLRLLSPSEIRDGGFSGAATWLEEAERIWTRERGAKAGKMTLLQRLDHVRGLAAQDMNPRWRVIYPNFQRSSVACVVDTRALRLDGGPARFVVDTALYGMGTDNQEEARYLCAVLNSAVIDDALGPLRRGDQAAHPNVHKKLFDVAPIPCFDPGNRLHRDLARLAGECEARVTRSLETDAELRGGLSLARRRVRIILTHERREIEALTAELIGAQPRKTGKTKTCTTRVERAGTQMDRNRKHQ